MQTTANKSACTVWLLNRNRSISAKGEGRCIDVQNGEGPDVDIWHCKLPYSGSDPHAIADRTKQKFSYNTTTKQRYRHCVFKRSLLGVCGIDTIDSRYVCEGLHTGAMLTILHFASANDALNP